MQHKVSFAISAGAAALLVGLYFLRDKQRAVPEPEKPVAKQPPPASEYPLCRELDELFLRQRVRLGCATEASFFVDAATAHDRALMRQEALLHEAALLRALCEAPFKTKPACLVPLQNVAACAKKQPDSNWRCDAKGTVGLNEVACAPETAEFRSCIRK